MINWLMDKIYDWIMLRSQGNIKEARYYMSNFPVGSFGYINGKLMREFARLYRSIAYAIKTD